MKKLLLVALAALFLFASCFALADEASSNSELPPYHYTGTDEIVGAFVDNMVSGEIAEQYMKEPGSVTIPCPFIHKMEMIDDTHAKIYATVWIMNYVQKGEILEVISGGESPVIAQLELADGTWTVTDIEEADVSEDYEADIKRFANGDQELEAKYFDPDIQTEEHQAIRIEYIKAYVEANNLQITAFQDPGWDPVELK